MKSKLRIQIESYLIDINEEMFSISDELARAFLNPNVADQEISLHNLAREFEKRKDTLSKKIHKLLNEEPAIKINGNYVPIRSRSTSPAAAVRSRLRGSRSRQNRSITSQGSQKGSRNGTTTKSPKNLSIEDQKGLTMLGGSSKQPQTPSG